MTVARILRKKGSEVLTVAPGDAMPAIIEQLAAHQMTALVVVENEIVVGIISDRDVVRALAGDPVAGLRKTAAQIMTSEVITCKRDDKETELIQFMSDRGVRQLPVLDNGRLVGIISMSDVIKLRLEKIDVLMKSIESEAEEMMSYLSPAG